jgi:hypothetical protein
VTKFGATAADTSEQGPPAADSGRPRPIRGGGGRFLAAMMVGESWWRRVIRPKCIYNFLCSMLIYTPSALCFVTLCGVFMHFLELTY